MILICDPTSAGEEPVDLGLLELSVREFVVGLAANFFSFPIGMSIHGVQKMISDVMMHFILQQKNTL